MASRPGQTDAVVLAIASGKTHADAARLAGCSVRTVGRLLDRPDIQERIGAAKDSIFSTATESLNANLCKAADCLIGLLAAKSEQVRLSAARSVWEMAIRSKECVEFESRLTAIENALKARK